MKMLPVASALLLLTPQIDQINIEKIGKTEVVTILSQRLIIQGHYNKALSDLSNNITDRFYHNLTLKPSQPVSLQLYIGSLYWEN